MPEVVKMHDVVLEEFMNNREFKNIRDISIDIANTENAKWIYFFILKVLSRNIKIIENIDFSTSSDKIIIFNALQEILDIDINYLKEKIINTGNAEYIYKFQKNIISLIKRLEKLKGKYSIDSNSIIDNINVLIDNLKHSDLTDEIIKTKSLKYINKYSLNIKNSNKNKIYQEILKSRNPKYIYMFAKNNKGYDNFKLANLLIEIGNAKYMYLFAKDIDIDPKIFEEPISYSNSPKYIYLFAKDIKGINISVLQEAIIDTENIDYICEFAKNINCNFEIIEEDAIMSLNPEYIYKIARIKKYHAKELEQAIKQTNSPKYMYLFARDIRGVSVQSMELHVVRENNPKYMFLFARNIHGADIEYIGRMMFKTKNIDWIYKYFSEIPNANILFAVKEIKKYNLDPESKYTMALIKKFICSSIIPVVKKNIFRLGYMYDDVYMPIKELRNNNPENIYIFELIEKYYKETNKEQEQPKIKLKTS